MARRPVAVVAAIVLLVEAVGIVVINGILANFVDKQNMSLDGLDPGAMVAGTWVMGGVFGLYLATCGVLCLLMGLRDRAPGRFARILLITCAVVHGVLGALTVGLVGWDAFAFLMVVLGLIVLTLVTYGKETGHSAQSGKGNESGSGNGNGNGNGAETGAPATA